MSLSHDADGLTIGRYEPADDAAALELERIAAQGRALRVSYRRETFRRRADNFERAFIVTARYGEQLAGVAAVAVKDVELDGRPRSAAYHFDYRVHPELRRRGVGQRMRRALDALAGADFHYTYVLPDNREVLRLAAARQAKHAANVSYLIYPCFRARPQPLAASEVSFDEAHAELVRRAPRFDFYCDPRRGGSREGLAGSWLVRRGQHVAGCSAWDRSAYMTESIEAYPLHVRWLGRALALAPRSWPLPRIPPEGSRIRSILLFDFFATDPALARGLLAYVNNRLRERGVEYCYVVHLETDAWLPALRSDLPKLVTHILPYRLIVASDHRSLPAITRPYVDVRDA